MGLHIAPLPMVSIFLLFHFVVADNQTKAAPPPTRPDPYYRHKNTVRLCGAQDHIWHNTISELAATSTNPFPTIAPNTIMSPIPSFRHHQALPPKSTPPPSSISTHPAGAYLPPSHLTLCNHVIWSRRPWPHPRSRHEQWHCQDLTSHNT